MNGGTPKTGVREYWDGSHLWITPAEMGKRLSPYVGDTERKITDLGLRNSSAQMLPPWSVILSSRAPIGHLVINTEPMATNQGCKGLIPSNQLHHKFLYYYLSSIVDLLNSLGTGATFKELSGAKLKEVAIPVPSTHEQQRIVGILDGAFDGIATAKANAEKNLQNAHALFESHLESVFTQRDGGWPTKQLGDVCDFEGGSQPPKSQFSYTPKQGYVRFLQIRDFGSEKHVTFIPESKRNRLCVEDDIMIGRYGASVGKILMDRAGAYNVALMKTIPDPAHLDRSFFYHYLISGAFQERLRNVAARSAQNGFSKEDIYGFPVPVPPLKEQRKVIGQIGPLSEETQRLESIYQNKLDALEELKKSLLHQAFNGKL
jgi:type I restriction enzyme S subunit